MGNIHIVTGYKGAAHVTSEDDGSLYAAIFGNGQKVLNRGNKFAASVISNNSIRVLDGDIMMQGRHVRLNENTYVDLTIENGAQDVSRNDLIVVRYSKDASTGVEDCNLVVIKGTAAASDPNDPAYTTGNILEDHDALNDMPLYRVPIVGLNVQTLVPLFEIVEDNLLSIGAKQTATKDLNASTDVADGDYFPFYDTSASANKKTLWSNIVSKIRSAFFGTLNGILKANGSGSLAVVEAVPVTNGGTGATTTSGARSNLGITPANIGALANAAGVIGATHIANGAVTSAKIANSAVGTTQLATGAANSAVIADKAVTAAKLAADAVKLTFTNKSVAASAFVSNSTYSDFPYRAAVALTGVTAAMVPEVFFGLTDAMSGNFAPVAESYAGGIYIYAAAKPSAAITIPTILCWR